MSAVSLRNRFSIACEEVRAATGLDFERARVRAGFGRGHLLDVIVHVPGGTGDARERRAAELLVSALLGEELFETWIGGVSAVPAPRGGLLRVLGEQPEPPNTFPIAELGAAVEAARRGLMDGLPAAPFCDLESDADWTMLESTPEPRADYAAQDDLILASTRAPEMLKCFLEGKPFSSQRFSRHGETFAYLKVDHGELAPKRRVEERTRIEDALDPVLREARLGSVVGNGLGLRYSYVDLALLDAVRAVGVLVEAGRRLGLPRRSWILFCDSARRAESFSVWQDAPQPPAG